MFKKLLLPAALLLLSATLFTSCSKDDETIDNGNPAITFKTGEGYTWQDVVVKYNDTIKVGLAITSNGSDNLTHLKITANDQVVKDTTISVPGINMEFSIIKGLAAVETWKFEIGDAAGHTQSKNLKISRINLVTFYSGVVLGAQNNTADNGFMSATSGLTYSIDGAFENQELIDLFCFYEDTPEHQNLMTLAAPGSNITGIFTGEHAPEFYTTQNRTYFVKTDLTPAEFNAVTTDDLMLTKFDNESKLRKAKKLNADEVYVLLFQNGKYGLLKVISVEGTEDGRLTFDLKVQQ